MALKKLLNNLKGTMNDIIERVHKIVSPCDESRIKKILKIGIIT